MQPGCYTTRSCRCFPDSLIQSGQTYVFFFLQIIVVVVALTATTKNGTKITRHSPYGTLLVVVVHCAIVNIVEVLIAEKPNAALVV